MKRISKSTISLIWFDRKRVFSLTFNQLKRINENIDINEFTIRLSRLISPVFAPSITVIDLDDTISL